MCSLICLAGDGVNGSAPEASKLIEGDGPHPPPVKVVLPVRVNPLLVFRNIIFYPFTVYLVFTCTLACFPAVTVLVKSVNDQDYPDWANRFFIPVCCFVLFNVGDYLGRLIAEKAQWPRPGKMGMIIVFVLSILRFVFIPLFLMCNANPTNRTYTSNYFTSDTAYIAIMSAFSLTNGYLANVAMISAPQTVIPEEKATAASIMVALLGLGLGSGALLSSAVVSLL